MRVDGKIIASEIKKELAKRVREIHSQNILPHLAVILVGDDPSSQAYIRQKKKVGEEIGIKISKIKDQRSKRVELISLVNKLNHDSSIHGVIIQRPLPVKIDKDELDKLVIPQKDVDGFHPKSPFTPPVALAVLRILKYVFLTTKKQYFIITNNYEGEFIKWLKEKKILIIGRGETAGTPVANTFKKMNINFNVAHSQTKNIKELCLLSDIIISCVGKPNIVRRQMITDKTTLIGVGLHLENGKLQTDYNQEEVSQKALYYTPVPGGVGPVNVACLFENLVKAASIT